MAERVNVRLNHDSQVELDAAAIAGARISE